MTRLKFTKKGLASFHTILKQANQIEALKQFYVGRIYISGKINICNALNLLLKICEACMQLMLLMYNQ